MTDMCSNVLPMVHYANAYAWQQQTIKTWQQQQNQNVHSISIIDTLAQINTAWCNIYISWCVQQHLYAYAYVLNNLKTSKSYSFKIATNRDFFWKCENSQKLASIGGIIHFWLINIKDIEGLASPAGAGFLLKMVMFVINPSYMCCCSM